MNNPNLKLLYCCINQLNNLSMIENYYGFASKSDVVKFALLSSSKVTDGVVEIDYSKAQEIIDFVCKNVELPDVQDCFSEVTKILESYIKKE